MKYLIFGDGSAAVLTRDAESPDEKDCFTFETEGEECGYIHVGDRTVRGQAGKFRIPAEYFAVGTNPVSFETIREGRTRRITAEALDYTDRKLTAHGIDLTVGLMRQKMKTEKLGEEIRALNVRAAALERMCAGYDILDFGGKNI